ncbi:MAG TPA: asparagine synthase-related protein, partial [Candidatus Angelobacter sp.]|nr:asparagine synthase-related protein [Candidatus Angelobacter sp.]
MAIAGITVTRHAKPLGTDLIGSMLSALAPGESSCSELSRQPLAQLGAISNTGTASVWSNFDVAVACDAELVTGENGGAQPKPAAEVIGTLYLRYGLEFFSRLRGSFALAIWDSRSEEMLIAVDRFAALPLSYYASDSELIFASQPRGIFASGRVQKEIDPDAVIAFLNYSVVPAPQSAFQSLAKIPGGCYLVWKRGKFALRRYWDLLYSEIEDRPVKQLADALLTSMSEAVKSYAADVENQELGCFLSGGTDSSSILGLLTRHRGKTVNAFSIGFSEERFNELEYAFIAAKTFDANHSICLLSPEQTFPDVTAIAAAYDEPFGNSSVLPTFACLKLAREHGIKVMLAGDGGDELFGGNERYRTEQIYGLYNRVPSSLRRYLIEPLAYGLPALGPVGKARRYIERVRTGNPERYFQWLLLQTFPAEKVLSPEIQPTNGHSDLLRIARRHYEMAPASSELNRLLYIDIKMTLGDNDLPKVVRAAELAGVSVRFPYLDHPLADFSGRLPANLKV